MKKLIAVILIMVLCIGGCSEEAPQEPIQSEVSSESVAEEIIPEPDFEIFEESGKFGVKNPEGEIVVPANYEKVTDCGEFFELMNTLGTYEVPGFDEETKKPIFEETPLLAYEIYFKEYGLLP